MGASPAAFLFGFLCISIILWLMFIFASRLLAWALSRIMGASVGFQVGGWKCLRDVVVKFKKGAVESISVGEIRLSLRQSLVKLGVGIFSRDPKLQILICDLEVVMRASNKSVKKSGSRKSHGSHGSGRGKWMVVANMARFLSLTVTELVFKTPKANVEVKEMRLDISKDGGSRPELFVKLHIFPISVCFGESLVDSDPLSAQSGLPSFSQTVFGSTDRTPAPFNCEEFSLLCELGHDREAGILIKNIDVTCGEVCVILSDKLFFKKKSDTNNTPVDIQVMKEIDGTGTSKKPDKKPATSAISKIVPVFPEKVGFTLPKLDVKFVNWEHALLLQNKIMGIQLKSAKSRSVEDLGESTKFDIQMEFSEIQLLEDAGISVVEILKLDILSSVYIPLQLQAASTIRSEIDIKLGGTQCNLTVSRLVPWMSLRPPKTNQSASKKESLHVEKPKSTEQKAMMWTCTVAAPEITIVLYNLSGSPVYHGCSQSAHIFANNISSTGTAVHMELGELNLHLSDEYQEGIKESLFGVETNAGSLLHIAKLSLDWGKKDIDSPEEGCSRCKMVLSSEVSGVGFYFTFRRLESLISTAFSYKALLKKFSASGKKPANFQKEKSSRPSGKGIQLVKFNLERCTVNFYGDVGLDKVTIEDPKRVNYGSQGGRVVISVSADGTPRTALVMSTISDEYSKLKYSVSLDIFHLGFNMNKEKQSAQIEVERARSIFQEYLEDSSPRSKVVLLDMQNAKLVRRPVGVAIGSLFSATDIAVRWEPDLHIALVELSLHLKLLMHTQKLQVEKNEETISKTTDNKANEINVESSQSEKQHKKRESIFAIDVEMLRISAEAGDGVETMVQVQSIFSENAKIGVLLEGLIFTFNEARILRSSRMQISRVPSVSASTSDSKAETVTIWNWVIQALDVHICLPYRLELRAIDDSVEDMLRALKLVTNARTKVILPFKKDSVKPKKASTSKIGCVRFCIKKLAADIEEEPLQGWLDEHYRLLKNEARETAVRLNFLDDTLMKAGQTEKDDSVKEFKICFEGEEINIHDNDAIEKLRNEIYKQSFRAYYQACQKLSPSDGSGACKNGFQSGFKPSTGRTSLMSISATELDITLRRIDGGDAGMIEVLQKLDPVCRAHNIPFSRLYGSNLTLSTGSLVACIRDYTCPLFAGTSGKCEGRLIMAQQATPFQPQMHQDVYIGKWRNVRLLRSATGTTPPMKTFLDLPLHFQKAEVSFGVGFEPSLTDISYAFTVALRRANLSVRNPGPLVQPPKKEKSLPWWDEMRNYIHGHTTLLISETKWNVLASTDPYEFSNKLQIRSGYMEIQQSDGRIFVTAKDFKILLSSLECLLQNSSFKQPAGFSGAFLEAPTFSVEVIMEWECESGNPLNHYLFALPKEGVPREFVYDPFRSTSLSLRWNLSLRPYLLSSDNDRESSSKGDNAALDESHGLIKSEHATDFPIVNVGPHDLAWLMKFYSLNYIPPVKLRFFSRYPRFGVPRIPRSGNLSMDKVMTEFMFRIDATPTCIRNMPIDGDDPAKGLTFKMNKLKYEIYFGRGKQKWTFECKRDLLDLVYQGVDLHVPKAFIDKENSTSVAEVVQMTKKGSLSASGEKTTDDKSDNITGSSERQRDDGFLLSSDYFTIRRQSPKADPERLLAWQEAGRRNLEMTYVKSEFENGSESDDRTRSDPSDDDGYNIVIADNCQRIFVYGLKLLWNIENRDAIWSWVGGLSKAFAPPKPSPSRQYAQRKLLEENKGPDVPEISEEEKNRSSPVSQDASSLSAEQTEASKSQPSEASKSQSSEASKSQSSEASKSVSSEASKSQSSEASKSQSSEASKSQSSEASKSQSSEASKSQSSEASKSQSSPSSSTKTESFLSDVIAKNSDNAEQEGTRHFMVNVIEPQFNLHSEDANGRFLLAAVSGRVLARSFHSVLQIGYEMIEQAIAGGNAQVQESQPEMTWNRMEFSVMLEHVQAHVAPTDVDPGAGLQWLPKIRRSSPKVKRTGALLERVFMPCDMYFRYTRHKGGRTDLKVKPLKELTFNSHNITATMTSRQFQVMLDVLTNLLFARLPKPRKSSLTYQTEDDDVEEEADEVVPDGVEEVELAKVELEQKERSQKIILDDIGKLSAYGDAAGDQNSENESDLWMITGGRSILVQKLKKELANAQKSRKAASASLRTALQKAAQQRLMEKDKNKTPSYAMRISLQINKVVWSMLVDGKSFAEAEINDMVYDFDRDYKDVGVARFTTKYFVVRNCLPNAKSDMLLSAWNPPPEWGKKVMLRVDAKQGAPKEGHSPLELFQVEIYPLKIHLTETMYRMMWEYFFPEERRQEVWKISTTASSKRAKKGLAVPELSILAALQIKDSGTSSKLSTSTLPVLSGLAQSSLQLDFFQPSKTKNSKSNTGSGSTPELRRTSSFDRTWEESVAESIANELLTSESFAGGELPEESFKSKSKESKSLKPARTSHEEKKAGKVVDDKGKVVDDKGKVVDDKRSRPKRLREFHNIKISQVELLVTYEGSRFAVSDLRLLMDTFHRVEFTGTWRRLFSRVKKHIIWGVLKSVTGMQGKKFKDVQHQREASGASVPDIDLNFSDSDGGGSTGKSTENPLTWPKRPTEGAGEGFVTSVRGLFSSQRKKAKAFVLRTMRGEAENDHADWSDSEAEFSPFARQMTITKAKKLIRRHTKKFRSRGQKGASSQQRGSLPSSPTELTKYDSDSSSGGSSPFEDFAAMTKFDDDSKENAESSK